MTILKHELRQNRTQLLVWTAAIAGMLGLCVLIYPEMAKDMGDISALFAGMGSFSAAFGLDRINFGEFIGFFGVECGNVLGIGGAFFAAMTGISALSREEGEHTADFLLTHPVPRVRVVAEKYAAVLLQILLLNAASLLVIALCIVCIGENVPVRTMAMLLFSQMLMQAETATVCFGLSAALCRNGTGIGLGMAALMYFLNIAANLTESASFLKYLTPFGYTEGADIIANQRMDGGMIALGIGISIAAAVFAFVHYCRKDMK